MSQNLRELDQALAIALEAGDEEKIPELADQFEAHGLGQLASVLREKGAVGARELLTDLGI